MSKIAAFTLFRADLGFKASVPDVPGVHDVLELRDDTIYIELDEDVLGELGFPSDISFDTRDATLYACLPVVDEVGEHLYVGQKVIAEVPSTSSVAADTMSHTGTREMNAYYVVQMHVDKGIVLVFDSWVDAPVDTNVRVMSGFDVMMFSNELLFLLSPNERQEAKRLSITPSDYPCLLANGNPVSCVPFEDE